MVRIAHTFSVSLTAAEGSAKGLSPSTAFLATDRIILTAQSWILLSCTSRRLLWWNGVHSMPSAKLSGNLSKKYVQKTDQSISDFKKYLRNFSVFSVSSRAVPTAFISVDLRADWLKGLSKSILKLHANTIVESFHCQSFLLARLVGLCLQN